MPKYYKFTVDTGYGESAQHVDVRKYEEAPDIGMLEEDCRDFALDMVSWWWEDCDEKGKVL